MAEEEEFPPEQRGENTMLRDAMDALREGDRARARDLLTRLLKTDQKNPTYWVWLSAAMETQKEQLYCLQMAIQADPDNAVAKRGLTILGGMAPDDSMPPFPVNRPRQWEEKLILPKEPRAEGKRGWANPVVRLLTILIVATVVLGGLYYGSLYLRLTAAPLPIKLTSTHHPTFTLSLTPSETPLIRTATPTFVGATPLWMFLNSTYTPTPLYVLTEHPVTSQSAFESALRFLAVKDYTNALVLFQQAIGLEPDAPDLYYYIGEIYRVQGIYRKARDAYQKAIEIDPLFAPAFLGRAESNLGINPNAEILDDLGEAIILDPNFTEAYIVRGAYLTNHDALAAEADLTQAVQISPGSAMAYLDLANVQLVLGKFDSALASAIRANQLDLTLVPAYLTLGQAYLATGQAASAVSVLQTYTIYAPDDTSAFLKLGIAYNAAGQYASAVDILTKAASFDRRNAQIYFQRGTAYLNLDKPQLAEDDFKLAITYDPSFYDAHLALAMAYDKQGFPGDAYVQVEKNVYPLAKTDKTKAQVYYWEAIFLEEIGDPSSLEGAKNDWNQLISLPAEAMPEQWRNEAFLHLNKTPTFTPTTFMTQTPSLTNTRFPTLTPTLTVFP
jgi:tetratricopeptide (TPR) repeat protein